MKVRAFIRGEEMAYEGYIYDTGDTLALLGQVYRFLTADERPNRAIAPPLGAGDVITFFGGPRQLLESYTISVGSEPNFTKSTPIIGSMHQALRYLGQQRASGIPNVTQIPKES